VAWLALTRGLEREHVDAEGRTVAHVTDETINRALGRHHRAFLYREARLADEGRYAEWLARWTDDAVSR
jgi:hypothetical protein